ncbi:MAG: hypothetical protein LBT38_03700 [Deltaproteobacteria bacterium]|nr:hypothetical protein [Deltaproteobacteria bacterium]
MVGLSIGSISNSYATGLVSGELGADIGGLAGIIGGSITNSYYNSDLNTDMGFYGRYNNNNYPGTSSDIGTLDQNQFNDSDIRSTILSGGDVQEAVGNFIIREEQRLEAIRLEEERLESIRLEE